MDDDEVQYTREMADWEDDGSRPEFLQDSVEYDDE